MAVAGNGQANTADRCRFTLAIAVARMRGSCGPTCRQYVVYKGVISADRHKAITKKARRTHHIERCNNTLRQRVSRLVRQTLAFSKKLANHIGAIRYFICHYNLRRSPALHV